MNAARTERRGKVLNKNYRVAVKLSAAAAAAAAAGAGAAACAAAAWPVLPMPVLLCGGPVKNGRSTRPYRRCRRVAVAAYACM